MEGMLPLFEPKGRVLLVDGHHLAYRTFHALKGLTTSRGEPVQAVYGFAKSLLKALKEDGDSVIVVFDAKAPSFRHEAYEGYKAGRAPTPEDFPRQLALIKELVDLLGLARLEVPGYEADDVLASLAKKAEKEGYEVRILTADKDLYQLLSDRIHVLHPEGYLITPAWLWEKYGLRPDQWADYRALTGDESDNLPGVKGIGEKTARKLLEEWGSLERPPQEPGPAEARHPGEDPGPHGRSEALLGPGQGAHRPAPGGGLRQKAGARPGEA
jgi:DNA polymerase-1